MIAGRQSCGNVAVCAGLLRYELAVTIEPRIPNFLERQRGTILTLGRSLILERHVHGLTPNQVNNTDNDSRECQCDKQDSGNLVDCSPPASADAHATSNTLRPGYFTRLSVYYSICGSLNEQPWRNRRSTATNRPPGTPDNRYVIFNKSGINLHQSLRFRQH